jgi:hypothetical protein
MKFTLGQLKTRLREHRLLLLLLLFACAARWSLVYRGGQTYWPDEGRYWRSLVVVEQFSSSGIRAAVDALLDSTHHTGFTVVALPAAYLHAGASRLSGKSLNDMLWVPALVLSCASVVAIALTYGISLRAGSGKTEAMLAAGLFACAHTMFYYSRHLFPYDSSIALALGGLWIALGPSKPGLRSFLAGVFCGGAFVVYNGYWHLVLVVLILQAVQGATTRNESYRRLCFGVAGGAVFPVILLLLATWRRIPFLTNWIAFSETVTLGDFAEGWRLPWQYLWHTEHGLLILLMTGTALAVRKAIRLEGPNRRRGAWWVFAAMLVYGLLVLSSSVIHLFVVYGRMARAMVPFLCLSAAFGLVEMVGGRIGIRRRVVAISVLLVLVQAGWNAYQPLVQTFPAEIRREVRARYGAVACAITIAGAPPLAMINPEAAAAGEATPGRYVLVNAQHLYPVKGLLPAPSGRVVFQTPHPLAYRPYQYAGFTPGERALLSEADLSMMLIDTAASLGRNNRQRATSQH